MLDVVSFWVLAAVAVVCGYLVFRVDSMVRATFSLLTSFIAVAGVLLVLDADFLGGIIVQMLVGEMVIMAVFMVMYMMNPAGLMPMTMVHNKRFSLGAALGTFVVLSAGILLVPWPHPAAPRPADVTRALGEGLMGPKMLVMMVAGVALFATMVAGVLLATDRGRYDRYGDELDGPATDPLPGALRP